MRNNRDYGRWSDDDRGNNSSPRNGGYNNRERSHQPPYGTHIPPVGTPPDYSRNLQSGNDRYDDDFRSAPADHLHGFSDGFDDEIERHRHFSEELYGEHPASMGKREYLGSNKRHPGLGYSDYISGEENREEHIRGRVYDNNHQNFYPPHKKHQTHEFIPGKPKPRHSDDYHHASTGQYMEIPGDDRWYDERDYHRQGHQNFRETEGFGRREGDQPGQDWISMGDYPTGHRQGRRIYSKYNDKL